MQPLVSVIVPCYNYGLFLPQTLDSVLDQTYPHWECLIVDDGSADNTREVALAYAGRDNRFRYMYQPNAGVSAARNNGIAHSRGECIQLLDADDLLEPQKLSAQVELLRRYPDCDAVYSYAKLCPVDAEGCFTYLEDGTLRSNAAFNRQFPVKGEPLFAAFMLCCPFPINMPLLKRDVFKRAGVFDTSLDSSEDWDFWIRCAYAGLSFRDCRHSKSGVLIRVHNAFKKQDRKDFAAYMTIRKRVANLDIPFSLKKLNQKYKYIHCITHFRRIKKPLYQAYYSVLCVLLAPPTSFSEFKIFVGDVLFPRLYSSYLKLKNKHVTAPS